eukprot:358413-Chlamydomonas_euryale.AAC.10
MASNQCRQPGVACQLHRAAACIRQQVATCHTVRARTCACVVMDADASRSMPAATHTRTPTVRPLLPSCMRSASSKTRTRPTAGAVGLGEGAEGASAAAVVLRRSSRCGSRTRGLAATEATRTEGALPRTTGAPRCAALRLEMDDDMLISRAQYLLLLLTMMLLLLLQAGFAGLWRFLWSPSQPHVVSSKCGVRQTVDVRTTDLRAGRLQGCDGPVARVGLPLPLPQPLLR